jgi:hypothetical protein
MKVRVKVRPNGNINGQPWPEVGDTIDLPEVVVDGMGDWVEPVKAEKKADKKATEKKVEKVEKVEKRPASDKGVETRVSPDAR